MNQATNLLDRVIKLERGLEAIRKLAGLTSAIISRGGLTLLNNSFIKMIASDGDQVFFVGPDANGVQMLEVRRDNGSLVLRTYVYVPTGQQYWALSDRSGTVLVSDDAGAGAGLARPWIPVPLAKQFHASGTLGDDYGYSNLPVASLAGETTLWEGRVSISHPQLQITGAWGQASGSNTATYRVRVNGAQIGTWATGAALSVTNQGPFDVSTLVGQDWIPITVTCAASGTGNVACEVYACYLRQSP